MTTTASICTVCGTTVVWVQCPTGSWWAHNRHPADNHDAVVLPRPYSRVRHWATWVRWHGWHRWRIEVRYWWRSRERRRHGVGDPFEFEP